MTPPRCVAPPIRVTPPLGVAPPIRVTPPLGVAPPIRVTPPLGVAPPLISLQTLAITCHAGQRTLVLCFNRIRSGAGPARLNDRHSTLETSYLVIL